MTISWFCGKRSRCFFGLGLIVAMILIPAAASGESADLGSRAIRGILDADQKAHLTGDASLIGANLDETVVEVSGGTKSVRSGEEIEAFFRERFETVDYSTWKDIEPPTIRISADSTMAWVVRSIYAELEVAGTDGRPARSAEFTSVYTSTYEVLDGRWKLTSVTSTFLPPG